MKKRGKTEKREKIQETLERYGRFDYDYIPFGRKWTIPDANYRYRQNFFHRALSAAIRCILFVVGPLLIKIAYGARVTGRKNLKELGRSGAICVSNHFSYLDTLFVRQAIGQFRSYHTMAPWNNKTGFLGWLMHHAGMLPFSSDLTATRNLWKELERLLAEGKIVNFYAEQAMWVNYQKPRPMKDGAFFFAVRHNVPVVPVFCTFKKTGRGRMKHLRIHILPVVRPDASLPKGERIRSLRDAAQEEWRICYETAYRRPLVYLRREQEPERSAAQESSSRESSAQESFARESSAQESFAQESSSRESSARETDAPQ